jgi:hypothetical protein
MAEQGGHAGNSFTAAVASRSEKWRKKLERPSLIERRPTIRLRMKGEAATVENTAPPWLRTAKASGKEVKWKFRAFATEKELKRGDREPGVIQNRLNSQVPPMAEATNEWNDESIDSRKAAPGVRCIASSFLGTAGGSGRGRLLPSRPGTAEMLSSAGDV